MALTKKDYDKIKEELDNCKKPLYLFHDDADGLASFLLFYKYKREGKGLVIKKTPRIDSSFVRKVDEYMPDKVFILDIAMVDQEFLDKVDVPVIWIDHHSPLKRSRVKYFNPMKKGNDNPPVSYLCYNVVKENIWIAMAGCVGDWYLPDFKKDFIKQYPDLLDSKIKKPQEALFNSKVGVLANVFDFIPKWLWFKKQKISHYINTGVIDDDELIDEIQTMQALFKAITGNHLLF